MNIISIGLIFYSARAEKKENKNTTANILLTIIGIDLIPTIWIFYLKSNTQDTIGGLSNGHVKN
jgi:hypothetical protein